MEQTQLELEIEGTIEAIKVLKEDEDEGALILAVNDLAFLQSQK